ncbi:MAG: ATP synthase F1 subunit gamma [Candidatus Levybacteria bacterium]|nr:ATP synthase F1 subunit gamma [Candidatus Levybacteria bacterium]
MANTIQLKRRIKTAQNVSKTTRAMQMIAASKMKRAQEAALATRAYVEKITMISKNLIHKLDYKSDHPYLVTNKSEKTLFMIFSPDKGLCGGLITALAKEYLTLHKDSDIFLVTVGKKIEIHAARSNNALIASFEFGTSLPTMDKVYPLVNLIDDYLLTDKVSSVKILSSNFINIFTQKPTIHTILPIKLTNNHNQKIIESFGLFEPSISEILPSLLKRFLEITVYQLLLESFVSEQSARMISMQNATDNAKDIIQDLTLEYNKARQAKITNEILDIAGGAISANT